MRHTWLLVVLLLAGCSTHPVVDVMDFFQPGKMYRNDVPPYGGVCGRPGCGAGTRSNRSNRPNDSPAERSGTRSGAAAGTAAGQSRRSGAASPVPDCSLSRAGSVRHGLAG